MTQPRTLVLIPARMAATRLPGKPLLDIAGLPMIVHVLRRAEAARIGRVAVATDTPEIAAVVTCHGGEVVMTRADHPSGSDRIYEALCKLDPAGKTEVIVNDLVMLGGGEGAGGGKSRGAAANSGMDQRAPEEVHSQAAEITDDDIPF